MRQGQNKRIRGRNNNNNNNRRGPNPLTRSYESNGPDVKIRGTAHHVAEKYLQLARDAQTSGDPVMAESYLQHAEHYFRLIAAAQLQQQQAQSGVVPGADADDGDDDDDFGGLPDRFASPQERVLTPQQQPQANGFVGGGAQPVPERAASSYERHDAAPRTEGNQRIENGRQDQPRQDQPRQDQPRQERQEFTRPQNGQRNDHRGDNRPDNRGDNRSPRPERGFYLDRQNPNQNQNGQRRSRDFRYDQPRPDQSRQDLPRPEQPRQEAPRQEAPRQDVSRQDVSRQDSRRDVPVMAPLPERNLPEVTVTAALPAFITAPTRPIAEALTPVIAERSKVTAPEAVTADKPRRRRRTKAEMEADAARSAGDAGLLD